MEEKKIVKKVKKNFSTGRPNYDKLIEDIDLMRNRIKQTMSRHIGEENFITPIELFEKVYGVNPLQIEYYKRYFLWNIIRKMIILMRKNDDIYIINKSKYLFVLKTEREFTNHYNFLEKNIKGLRESQRRARDWVATKKWKTL